MSAYRHVGGRFFQDKKNGDYIGLVHPVTFCWSVGGVSLADAKKHFGEIYEQVLCEIFVEGK